MDSISNNKDNEEKKMLSSEYQSKNRIRKYISIAGIVFGLLIIVWAGYKFNIEYNNYENSTALYSAFSAIFNILFRGGAGLLVLLISIAIFFISVSNTARKN